MRHPFPQSTDYAEIEGKKVVLNETYRGHSDDMQFHINWTHVGDSVETFVGEKREDGLFTTADSPFTHYIDPIDNSLTYVLARDGAQNK